MKDNAEVTAVNAEEKNTFALSVLRRIKMKLDGREPDVLRKATVAEQVDCLFTKIIEFVCFYTEFVYMFRWTLSFGKLPMWTTLLSFTKAGQPGFDPRVICRPTSFAGCLASWNYTSLYLVSYRPYRSRDS